MNNQVYNPYLPSYEYVPDGEPYVFGDRLYVFGSHDAFGADQFCVNDYVCWSAPVANLSDWQYEGIIYRASQDPANAKGDEHMNAPDVCLGRDGRYYLYYQLHREVFTSVAVADSPAGPYVYYGVVHHPDGTTYGKKKGDAYVFDPGVLLDDDGKVYLYSGFCPNKGFMRTIMKLRGGLLNGGYVVELASDMVTLCGKQYETIPGEIAAGKTPFVGHGFYEASSIRKINGTYYLVYSSILSHELCYATSQKPIGPWSFGGTLVSIGDIGLSGITRENGHNFTGNTHGGMVELNGQWYIFYHRQTNQQMCARQGCAEPIYFNEDGGIEQVEITSCGLNGGPLLGKGTYEARIACNLWGKDGTFAYVKPHHEETGYPYFTQSGTDRNENPDQYIANMHDGSVAGFKYFDIKNVEQIKVTTRGAEGVMEISISEDFTTCERVQLKASEDWVSSTCSIHLESGRQALFFRYCGTGSIDFKDFTLS